VNHYTPKFKAGDFLQWAVPRANSVPGAFEFVKVFLVADVRYGGVLGKNYLDWGYLLYIKEGWAISGLDDYDPIAVYWPAGLFDNWCERMRPSGKRIGFRHYAV
jgi:hypothetical protein